MRKIIQINHLTMDLIYRIKGTKTTDGGHLEKWPPLLSQGKSAMGQQSKIFLKVYSNSVPNFMLLSSKAQFIFISAVLCIDLLIMS